MKRIVVMTDEEIEREIAAMRLHIQSHTTEERKRYSSLTNERELRRPLRT